MTSQIKDLLIYKRKKHGIHGPLLPGDGFEFPFTSSACWRGYVATWKIANNKLYLLNLTETAYGDVGVKFLFPGKKKVFANWVTDSITFRDTETEELQLYFESGILTRERRVAYKRFDLWDELTTMEDPPL